MAATVDPSHDTEMASEVSPLYAQCPAPKGKRMHFYRPSSSALTGRAPRSMRDAFGCSMNDPVHPMPGTEPPALLDALGQAAMAVGRFVARLFGR